MINPESLTTDAALLALKDYDETLESARRAIHNVEYWDEESWVPGLSIDELVSQKRQALEVALRAALDREREMQKERDWWETTGTWWADTCREAWMHRDLARQRAEQAERERDHAHKRMSLHATNALQCEAERDALAAELQRLRGEKS